MFLTEKGFRYALSENVRVIGALVIRSGVTRFGESRIGYLWTLAEPKPQPLPPEAIAQLHTAFGTRW